MVVLVYKIVFYELVIIGVEVEDDPIIIILVVIEAMVVDEVEQLVLHIDELVSILGNQVDEVLLAIGQIDPVEMLEKILEVEVVVDHIIMKLIMEVNEVRV